MREFLEEGIKKIGVSYEKVKIDKLLDFAKILIDYNKHTNLTAVRDEKEMIEKHFLDSILVDSILKTKNGINSTIDIGTGAGFPGMVLGILNPSINFTLMDSVSKKTIFLNKVKEELDIQNVEVINSRAEDYINDKRETYDLGLCRGVSKLPIILEYVIPFLKVGGIFLPQKMDEVLELEEAENALELLKCECKETYIMKLPYLGDKRVIFEIIKNDKTDIKYPRRSGIAKKRPL